MQSSPNRRSFVKTSLATTVSLTFSGLIWASGEEGVTTVATTVWIPDETTAATTQSTSTWNPDETNPTTLELTTTWNPDETTASTIVATLDPNAISLHKVDEFEVDPITSLPVDTGDPSPTIIPKKDGFITITKNGQNLYHYELAWVAFVYHSLSDNPNRPQPANPPPSDTRSASDCMVCSAGYNIMLILKEAPADDGGPGDPNVGFIVNAALQALTIPGEPGNNKFIEVMGNLNLPPDGFSSFVIKGISVQAVTGWDYKKQANGPLVQVTQAPGRSWSSQSGIYLAISTSWDPIVCSENLTASWDIALTFENFPYAEIRWFLGQAVEAAIANNQLAAGGEIKIKLPVLNNIRVSRHQNAKAFLLYPNEFRGSCPVQFPDNADLQVLEGVLESPDDEPPADDPISPHDAAFPWFPYV